MNKVTLAFVAVTGVLLSSCGGKTEADFSIVPVKGSNGEYQYIDISQKGKIAINPQFSKANIFRDGLAMVKSGGRDGKYGYIDKKGKFAIAPVYNVAQDFSEGVAWVQMEDQPPMLINKKGKTVLQIDSLVQAYPFYDGIATVSVFTNGQEGIMFIDKKGNTAVTTEGGETVGKIVADGIYSFQNTKSKKWGYKNKKGEVIIGEQFDLAAPFFDGMAIVMSGGKYGAINKKGEYLINPQYDELVYDSDGLFRAKVGRKYGWVNKKGETVINPQFDQSLFFWKNKLAPVVIGNKWAYIDRNGQITINPQFDGALSFNKSYAMVEGNGGEIGFINTKGEFAVHPLYYIDDQAVEEYVYASKQNVYGVPAEYYEDNAKKFNSYGRLREKVKAWTEKQKEESNKKTTESKEQADKQQSSFTDSRDGKTYKWVKIGNQTWMAENLNYNASGSKCYDGNEDNCTRYGRLYNWATAIDVCPSGWHLPSDEEWTILENHIGGSSIAGKKLKSSSGWSEGGDGTDNYGFSALPGGRYSEGKFGYAGNYGSWWSTTESNANNAYMRTLRYDYSNDILRGAYNKSQFFSVRCLKD